MDFYTALLTLQINFKNRTAKPQIPITFSQTAPIKKKKKKPKPNRDENTSKQR